MRQKQKGPYQHYQRPTVPRTVTYRSTRRKWFVLEVAIVLVLVALVPVGYYLASNLITDKQVVNVQKKVKKHAPAKSASSAKGQTKTKAKAKAPSKPKTKIKTAAQPQKGPQSKAKKTAGAKKYTVKVGESLTGIAQDHHMTVSKLAQLNDLDVNSRVEIGQVLKLK